MRAAIVQVSQQLSHIRIMCVTYEDSLELAMQRCGYPMRMVKVMVDKPISDLVVDGKREILVRNGCDKKSGKNWLDMLNEYSPYD